MLKKAKKIVASSVIEFKHIWIVFDKDDFPAANFNETCFECEEISNENTTYHALWSNQCIEYWFLLHYMYLDTPLNRKDYFLKLSKLMKRKYEKNQKEIYELLYPKLDTAIKNAKRIESQYSNLKPAECDPCTKIYEIFDILKSYL